MENLIPTLYGWVVILCQLLALFAIVIGIAKGFVIYCQNIFTVSRAAIAFLMQSPQRVIDPQRAASLFSRDVWQWVTLFL